MRSGRIFLHAARLTFPHPLHLSKEAWTPALSKHPIDVYSSGSDSELESEDVADTGTDRSIWMGPTTSLSEDPKTRHQLLTIRASLPEDLQEVLYAIPEGLDPQELLSLGLIFQ